MATKIKSSNIDADVLTGNTELSAKAAADDILLVYDTSSGTVKKIQASNVGMLAPVVSSISPTNVLSGDGTGNHTIVITGQRFSADATATLIKTGGSALAFDSVTRNSSTQITGVIAKSSLLNADEPFDVKVSTEGGVLSNTLENALTLDASPVFVTSAGSIGSVQETNAGSFSVNATDPESAGNVTFELQSGSLPPNFSLTNTAAEGGTAVISGTAGTVSAPTTYNFVLRAVDAASNTTSRAFAVTVNNTPVSQSFTSSGTFSVPSGTTVCDVLVVAGGGGANSQTPHPAHRGGSGGGGAGGLIFMPEFPLTPGGTITVTVGCGSSSGGVGGCSQKSKFGAPGDPGFSPTSEILIAIGGGKGGCAYSGEGAHSDGRPGGSGGGGNRSPGPGTAVQPTQPGDSGAYGFGNNGGAGPTTSGGGGGGAGAVGGNGPSPQAGGTGKAYTIADGTTSVYYAGGGGGGQHGGNVGAGGQGGGAPSNSGQAVTNGEANKGGGASGSSGTGQGSGTGGKGVVIVRY